MQRAGRALVVVVAAALALGACGGDETATEQAQPTTTAQSGLAAKGADEILKAATDAFRSASSVHVVGSRTEQGERVGVDLRIGQASGQGTFTFAGVPLRVLRLGVRVYLRGRKFWERVAGPQAGNVIGDRWVLVPESGSGAEASADLVRLTLLSGFADEVLKPDGELTKGRTGAVDGKPALELKDKEGSLWVATSGPPYPLRLEGRGGGGRLDFREYNAPVRAPTPPADPLDLGKLQQGG